MRYNNISEPTVPIWEKFALTITEAAAYSNIGINRIENLLRQEGCSFVLYSGSRKLVKRKAFEAYLSENTYIA